MVILMDKTDQEAVVTCSGCGMSRLCRRYKDVWLCQAGPSRCWKRRRPIYAELKDGKRRAETAERGRVQR